MRGFDVAIVGGGPAGSTCASALRQAGANVVVVDAARFPRDKVCAGWITPGVFERLKLDPDEYRAAGGVLQPLHGFRTSIIGDDRAVDVPYDAIVSYGIRRVEFDHFLLRRAAVTLEDGTPVRHLTRRDHRWVLNDTISASFLVGAGGHNCPVGQILNPPSRDRVVVAREIEAPWPALSDAATRNRTPEICFCRDLDGYGWCLPKGEYVNVGFGRRSADRFNEALEAFTNWLGASGRLDSEVLDWRRWKGHAYRLRGTGRRVGGRHMLLAGDAAGLAYAESGEGIAPAIESGLAAARLIALRHGDPTDSDIAAYAAQIGAWPPSGSRGGLPPSLVRLLLRTPFAARYALDHWFLRQGGARSAA